jgi:hypothetical protein
MRFRSTGKKRGTASKRKRPVSSPAGKRHATEQLQYRQENVPENRRDAIHGVRRQWMEPADTMNGVPVIMLIQKPPRQKWL